MGRSGTRQNLKDGSRSRKSILSQNLKGKVQNLNSKLKIVFFGSFQNYSVQVLEKLLGRKDLFEVVGVITTPPRPAGRNQRLKPTEVQVFAEKNRFPVFPLETFDKLPEELIDPGNLGNEPDLLVVAGYGKLIPIKWLEFPKIAPINIHFSLLPDYPGRFPAEWTILTGEAKTGVTIIRMSDQFDKGEIYAQAEVPVLKLETRETLYKKLYSRGGDLAVETLPKIGSGVIRPTNQDLSRPHKYARQISREDGFIPWDVLTAAMRGENSGREKVPLFREMEQVKDISDVSLAELIERTLRAFKGWPGVWTLLRPVNNRASGGQATEEGKRIKILEGHLEGNRLEVGSLQIEGRSPQKGKDAARLLMQLTQD